MPANSLGQIAIWQNASGAADNPFTLSLQDAGVRLRDIQTPSIVNLPASEPNDGDAYEVQDQDGSCSVANTVRIVPPAGTTIRGGATLVLSDAFVSARLVFDAPENDWTAEIAGSGGIAPGQTQGVIRYAIGTGASQPSATVLPVGAVVSDVQVEIDTPYSGGATIEVGQAGSLALFQATTDNNPQGAGIYDVPQDTPAGALAIVTTIGGAPGAGAGFVIVKWSIPSA